MREIERENVCAISRIPWARSARSIDPRASTYEIACRHRRGGTDCIRRYCVCVCFVVECVFVRVAKTTLPSTAEIYTR